MKISILPAAFVAASASIFLVVVVFLINPALLYYGNPSQFDFTFRSILPWLFALGALAASPLIGVALMLPGLLLRVYAGAISFAALFSIISAIYIVPDLGLLDGTPLKFDRIWVYLPWEIGASLAIIAFVAITVKRAPRRLGGALLATSVVAAVAISAAVFWQPKTALDAPDIPAVFSVSPEKNLLVVLLDGFQSDVFGEIISREPALSASLDGFTYYPNTLGVAGTTYLSLPSIHAGVEYQPVEPLKEYFDDALKRSFLASLANNNYDAALINPIRGVCPPGLKVCAFPSPILDEGVSRYIGRAARLVDLSIFRSSPLLLKRATYRSGNGIISTLFRTAEATHVGVEGLRLMEALGEKIEVNSTKSTAKFVHILSPHLPVVLDEACDFLSKPRPATRETFSVQAQCTLKSFASALAGLKAKGVYDSTAIILLADHGVGLPTTFAKESNDFKWRGLVGSANPLFAVKPIGARGALRISDAPVHLPDVPATVCDLLAACTAPSGRSALNLSDEKRDRMFNLYEWNNEYWTMAPARIPMEQHIVASPAWRQSSWFKVGAGYESGTSVSFGAGGTSDQFIRWGFANAEDWGRWTDGESAALMLRWIDPAPQGLKVTINARGFIPSVGHQISVLILANGQNIGEIQFDGEMPIQETTLYIPKQVLNRSGLIDIRFVIRGAVAPADLSISSDARKLGMGIHWLKLGPAK